MRNVTGIGGCSVASLKLAALTTQATKQPYCRLQWIVLNTYHSKRECKVLLLSLTW